MNEVLENLINKLDREIIAYKIVELSAPAMTVPDVIKFAKTPVKDDEVCKTIMLKTPKGFVGIFLRGYDRLDMKRLDQYFMGKVRFANAEEVKEHANVDPGAVCPLLLNVPLYIDQRALELKNTHFGSGDHMFGIEMNPNDLLMISKAKKINCT
ncbi:MAG TPA: YbaK/EbsC family protein [bacterium]|nr:YbaK/EbsC family protein [bacterium]